MSSEEQRTLCTQAWAKYTDDKNTKKLANILGLNKNMVAKNPPNSLRELIDRISTKWYEDFSAGVGEHIQVCIPRAGGHAIQESVEGKYSKMLPENVLQTLVTATCQGIFEDGVSPLHMINAWNGETGRGQQVASSDESVGYLVSLKGYFTDEYSVACRVSGLMINACSNPCSLVCVWATADAPVEMHALSVKISSDGVLKAIDRQKGGSRETVQEDRFVMFLVIDATIMVNGEEPECDEKYMAAMDEVRDIMKEVQPQQETNAGTASAGNQCQCLGQVAASSSAHLPVQDVRAGATPGMAPASAPSALPSASRSPGPALAVTNAAPIPNAAPAVARPQHQSRWGPAAFTAVGCLTVGCLAVARLRVLRGHVPEIPVVVPDSPTTCTILMGTPTISTILIGNPGTGKSAMVNCKVGELLFRSGTSEGGVGITYKLDVKELNGHRYMDTPGLSDIQLRKQAAEAIHKALQWGGQFQILFVFKSDDGRLRSDDVTTMKIVLEAVIQIKTNNFAIVVNMCKRKWLEEKLDEPSFRFNLRSTLEERSIPTTEFIHFAPVIDDLDGQDNAVAPLDAETSAFLNTLPVVHVDSDQVHKIRIEEYDELVEQMKALLEDNERLEVQAKRSADELYRERDAQEQLKRRAEMAEANVEKTRRDLEEAKNEGNEARIRLAERELERALDLQTRIALEKCAYDTAV